MIQNFMRRFETLEQLVQSLMIGFCFFRTNFYSNKSLLAQALFTVCIQQFGQLPLVQFEGVNTEFPVDFLSLQKLKDNFKKECFD
jgi:hypothetical protein